MSANAFLCSNQELNVRAAVREELMYELKAVLDHRSLHNHSYIQWGPKF